MRKVTSIIRVIFKQSLIAKEALPLITFFLLFSSVISQSKLDLIFDKLDSRLATSRNISCEFEKIGEKVLGKRIDVRDNPQNKVSIRKCFIGFEL